MNYCYVIQQRNVVRIALFCDRFKLGITMPSGAFGIPVEFLPSQNFPKLSSFAISGVYNNIQCFLHFGITVVVKLYVNAQFAIICPIRQLLAMQNNEHFVFTGTFDGANHFVNLIFFFICKQCEVFSSTELVWLIQMRSPFHFNLQQVAISQFLIQYLNRVPCHPVFAASFNIRL